jgi:hypothetical protein
LRADLAGTGLHIESCTATTTVLDEGPLHQGTAAVVRLVATREQG